MKVDRKEPLHASDKEHRHFGRSIIANGIVQRSWDRTPTCRVWYPVMNGHKYTVTNYATCLLCHESFLRDSSESQICSRVQCQIVKVMLGIRQMAVNGSFGSPIVHYNEEQAVKNGTQAFDEHPVFVVENKPKRKKSTWVRHSPVPETHQYAY